MKTIKLQDYSNHKVHDSDVIKKVISGDKWLFEILMRRNNQKLYRVIRSYINDEDVVKDVMQNTYLKAYEKLHKFNQKSEFSTWLIRIGINEALQEMRSKKSGTLRYINKLLARKDRTVDHANPETTMIQEEAKFMLENAISKLPEKYRVVYMLREVECMKTKEICDCLNLTESNVKVRLHRSKQMLKDILYKYTKQPNVFEFGFNKCDALVEYIIAKL